MTIKTEVVASENLHGNKKNGIALRYTEKSGYSTWDPSDELLLVQAIETSDFNKQHKHSYEDYDILKKELVNAFSVKQIKSKIYTLKRTGKYQKLKGKINAMGGLSTSKTKWEDSDVEKLIQIIKEKNLFEIILDQKILTDIAKELNWRYKTKQIQDKIHNLKKNTELPVKEKIEIMQKEKTKEKTVSILFENFSIKFSRDKGIILDGKLITL